MNEKDMMRKFYEGKKIRLSANNHGRLAIYQRVIDKYELGDLQMSKSIKIPFDDPKKLSEGDRNNAVAAAMIKHGKPSIAAMGQILIDTGSENYERIRKNCPKTWELYSGLAEVD